MLSASCVASPDEITAASALWTAQLVPLVASLRSGRQRVNTRGPEAACSAWHMSRASWGSNTAAIKLSHRVLLCTLLLYKALLTACVPVWFAEAPAGPEARSRPIVCGWAFTGLWIEMMRRWHASRNSRVGYGGIDILFKCLPVCVLPLTELRPAPECISFGLPDTFSTQT